MIVTIKHKVQILYTHVHTFVLVGTYGAQWVTSIISQGY